MNVFAKWVVPQNLLRQLRCFEPVLRFLGDGRQGLKQLQILQTIVRPLFINPGIVTALHELAAIKRHGGLITFDALVKLARPACSFPFGQQPIKLIDIDAVGKLRIQQIVPFAI